MNRIAYAIGTSVAVIAIASISLLVTLLFDFVLVDPFSPFIGRIGVWSPLQVIAMEFVGTFAVLSIGSVLLLAGGIGVARVVGRSPRD